MRLHVRDGGEPGPLLGARINTRSATVPLLFGCVLVAFFLTLHRELPALTDPQIINDDDVRVNMYWMRRFQDRALFQDDLLTDLAASPKYAPRGWVALYYVASYLIDPVRFSSVLPLILIPLTVFYLFRVGSLIRDNLAAVILALLYILIEGTSFYVPTGHARSFYLPFLTAFLYFLLKKRSLLTVLLVAMAPLFYPPLVPLFLGMLVLNVWDVRRRRLVLTRPAVLPIFLSLLLAFASLAPAFVFYQDARIGPMVTKEEALNMPEFNKGGREVYFRASRLRFLAFGNGGIAPAANVKSLIALLVLSAAVVITLRGTGRLSLPQEAVYLPIASLAMYLLAHLLLFRLYFPSRYTQEALPLFLMIFVSAHLYDAAFRWVDTLKQRRWIPHHLDPVTAFLLVILLSYAVFLYGRPERRSISLLRNPFPKLTDYLTTLPKDALIAGHPTDMDWVPLFSRRKVLVNDELSLPFYVNYYREISRRTYDLFGAYYARSPDQIDDFARKYGVDYLVVNLRHFSPDYLGRKNFYYRPFNEFIAGVVSQNLAPGFAVLRYPPDRIAFVSGPMMVIGLGRGPGNRAASTPLVTDMISR